MRRACLALLLIAAAPAVAQRTNPQIDYPGFQRLASQVRPHRDAHLVDFAAFSAMADRPGALILDARSESAFREGHIAGAVNLPLPDFTAEDLRRVIGRRDRTILIYCNNNFSNNRRPVVTKAVQLALNIQTYIQLYGYGYRNVYELNEVIDFNDPGVPWVGAAQARTAS